MKLITILLTIFWSLSPAIVVRHDKNDKDFQKLGLQLENRICHLNLHKTIPDGEGTLIHSSWILTAAHCAIEIKKKLDDKQKHVVTIVSEQRVVDKVIIHERWADNEAYDIALIHITEPTAVGKPVLLYKKDDELNKLVYIVGLGETGNGLKGLQGNDRKLRGATNRVDRATVFWLEWTFDNPDKTPNNATELEGISGPGDSGGPAFIRIKDELYVAGISSGQNTRSSNGVEGVYGVVEYYTRVSKYIDWINKNMKTNY